MPLSDRDYIKGSHPPTCTCTECVAKRLKHRKKDGISHRPRFTQSPIAVKLKNKVHPGIRTLTKLTLNLLILTGLVLLIRYGYSLFTESQEEPLKGSIILIIGIAIWIAIIKFSRSRKYRWAKPSFKLTTFLVILTLTIFTFAGVQPMSSYKDNLTSKWVSYQAEQKAKEAKRVAEAIAMTPALIKEAPTRTETGSSPTTTQTLKVEEAEREAFELINKVRQEAGAPPTKWNDELYKLSKAHTQDMANKGELFHTPIGATHGENAWGGRGYYHYKYEELARVIVSSWMSSPLHKAWLLHAPIQESVVSIVVTPNVQYASWSFWTTNLGRGPELVEKIAREWRSSGSNLPWIEWLISKGYLKP